MDTEDWTKVIIVILFITIFVGTFWLIANITIELQESEPEKQDIKFKVIDQAPPYILRIDNENRILYVDLKEWKIIPIDNLVEVAPNVRVSPSMIGDDMEVYRHGSLIKLWEDNK